MPKVKDVIIFLERIEGIQSRWFGDNDHLEQDLLLVSTDQDAKPGDLAWISLKQVEKRSEQISQFRGTLLIGPENIQVHGIPFVACNVPKLAFILVVNHFFSGASEISWPPHGQQIHKDVVIHPSVKLASGVVIGSGVTIEENVVIGPNTVIANALIRRNVVVGANCSIGLPGFGYEKDESGTYWRFPHIGGVVIEQNVEIGSNTCIDRGSIGNTLISAGVKIDNLVHIAHNVSIGPNSLIIANSMIGGSVDIGQGVWVAPSVSIMNQIHVGDSAVIGMGAVVLKSVEDHAVMVGNPAKILRKDVGNE